MTNRWLALAIILMLFSAALAGGAVYFYKSKRLAAKSELTGVSRPADSHEPLPPADETARVENVTRRPPVPEPAEERTPIDRHEFTPIVNSKQMSAKGISFSLITPGVAVSPDPKGLSFHMVMLPSGSFTMGSPKDDPDHVLNEMQHPVTLTKSFAISNIEVTQALYQKVMGKNPSRIKNPLCPVEMVSRDDAMEFCKKLSALANETFTLPTEAQWEYAARAGTSTKFFFGDNAGNLGTHAWHSGNSGNTTHPVAQKKPNKFGLYDILGNVAEWVRDDYYWYDKLPEKNPLHVKAGEGGIFRGGCHQSDAKDCRCAARMHADAGSQFETAGFRIVIENVEGGN